jgi:hypothetical protein
MWFAAHIKKPGGEAGLVDHTCWRASEEVNFRGVFGPATGSVLLLSAGRLLVCLRQRIVR